MKKLDVVVTGSQAGDSLVLRIVNRSDRAQSLAIEIEGMTPKDNVAIVVTLSASLDEHNTALALNHVRPIRSELKHQLPSIPASIEVAPFSFTTIRIR